MMNTIRKNEDERRHRRIRRVAGFMSRCCALLALALPICMALIWAYVEQMLPPRLPAQLLADLSVADRIGGFVLSLFVVGIAVWGLVSLATLFARFRRGDIFDVRAAILLRRFALTVLLLPFANLVTEGLTTAWLSRNAAPGEGMIALSLTSHDLFFGVIGVLLLMIAWILRDAAAISKENRLIV
ncbi:MAG: DUF2975 domain-containing protein [Alphaproteobacteria bacterium]|nr:DUF2975 domain-containing protein [Alphaproteobacteria bacterium]